MGGPAPGSPRPLPGTVTFTGQNHQTMQTDAGPNGDFSATVPVGHYTVTARNPQYQGGHSDCVVAPPSTVAVASKETTHVTVNCVER